MNTNLRILSVFNYDKTAQTFLYESKSGLKRILCSRSTAYAVNALYVFVHIYTSVKLNARNYKTKRMLKIKC